MLRALRHWIGLPREVEDTPTEEMLELGWKAILHHWKCLGWVVWRYPIAGSVELGWKEISHC